MSAFDISAVSTIASNISGIFRRNVRWLEKSFCLMSCCVIVLPPCARCMWRTFGEIVKVDRPRDPPVVAIQADDRLGVYAANRTHDLNRMTPWLIDDPARHAYNIEKHGRSENNEANQQR